MRIVVEYFLGWDREKNCNKPDLGLFDDLLAYVIAAEEQARKTIHGHILIWLKNWSRLYEKLNSESFAERQMAINDVNAFASRIMTTQILGKDVYGKASPCKDDCIAKISGTEQAFSFCTDQDIRNLRSSSGETHFGGKCIAKCNSCKSVYTTEDFAISKLSYFF